jgi:hypothetical protein
MTSSLVIEPLLSITQYYNLTVEQNIERQLILTAAFNRVEEELGERPEFKEDPMLYDYEIDEKICRYTDYLKRFACYIAIQNRAPLVEGDYDQGDARRVIEKYKEDFRTGYDAPFKHLLLFSHPASYYIPLDFHFPVLITEDMYITMRRENFPGAQYNVTDRHESIIIASSIRLISELDDINAILRVKDQEIHPDEPFYAEKTIFLALYKAAKFSIDKSQAIMWKEKSCVNFEIKEQ